MLRNEDEDAAELRLGNDFEKAKCLMNSEVAILLEHRHGQVKQMSDDALHQLPQAFEKSLQYVRRFGRFNTQDAAKQVREVLSRYRLTEFELAILGNLCPESVAEAIAVVPSLKTQERGLDEDGIQKLLNELSMIKTFA